DNRRGDVDELPVGCASVRPKQLEGGVLGYRVALHEDSLGALRDRAPPECALQAVVLGEAAKHHVDRALPFGPFLAFTVGDVGEYAALGGFADESRIRLMDEEDHRA